MVNIIELKEKGFFEVTAEEPAGVWLVRVGVVADFPYAKMHLVGDPGIGNETGALFEISGDGHIQFRIPDADYLEGPYPLESDDGQALLKDALAATTV